MNGGKTIDQMLEELIDREGGFVNNPADHGGPTAYGITIAVARANGFTDDMRSMSREQAKAIYRSLYWIKPHFDQVAALAPRVAEEIFDTGVNMGPAVAATFLQRALNALNRNTKDYPDLVVDGRLGPASLNALSSYMKVRAPLGEQVLIRALDCLQGDKYIRIAEHDPSQEVFLYGWLANRIGNAAP